MIELNALEKKFKDVSIDLYETISSTDDVPLIEFKSLDSLFDFAVKNNINHFFFHYDYINSDSLIIDDEIISGLRYDEDVLDILSLEFYKYNEKVEQLDFSKPVALNIFCVHQGFLYSYSEYDFWFVDLGFDKPEIAAHILSEKYVEEIQKVKEKKEIWIEQEREKLKEKILADPDFHKCKNANLRDMYARTFLKENPEIKHLFYSEKRRRYYDIPFGTFIDLAWHELKEKK